MDSEKGHKLAKTTRGFRWSKPVEQLDMLTGQVIAKFDSQAEASRATGIQQGHISGCCNGLALSAGGFVWRFAEDVQEKKESR